MQFWVIIPLVAVSETVIALGFASCNYNFRVSHLWYYHPNCTLSHAINYTNHMLILFLYKSPTEKECNYFRNCTQKVICMQILRGTRQPIRFQFYRMRTCLQGTTDCCQYLLEDFIHGLICASLDNVLLAKLCCV